MVRYICYVRGITAANGLAVIGYCPGWLKKVIGLVWVSRITVLKRSNSVPIIGVIIDSGIVYRKLRYNMRKYQGLKLLQGEYEYSKYSILHEPSGYVINWYNNGQRTRYFPTAIMARGHADYVIKNKLYRESLIFPEEIDSTIYCCRPDRLICLHDIKSRLESLEYMRRYLNS